VTPPIQTSPADRVEAIETPAGGSGRTRLGAVLVGNGAITETQLQHALQQQRQLKIPLGRVLLKMNYVTEEVMRQALAAQLGIPFVDLEQMVIDRDLARIIGKSYARRHSLLPVSRIGSTLTVVMDDPTSTAVLAELTHLTRLTITIVTATGKSIQRAFARLYDDEADVVELLAAENITPVEQESSFSVGPVDEQLVRRADELLRAVLFRALESRASDLHLEMLASGLRVRMRVDGVLRLANLGALQRSLDKSMREVVSRIKILSKLDIAERRRPQDGSFQVAVDLSGRKVNVDLRVSVIPSHSGESVVIRILDRGSAPRSLAELDLSAVVADRLDRLLRQPTGILLVTGPTGSGKSTTLFSCLMRLHRPEVRILTAEDPVEYVYDELSQSEVNDAIGNTFAHYLRAFLRHDPEVIMLGEIRDEETAEVAFRAAQTGHLLLSTLHTNSAIAALPRLLDLKVESSLIASSLIGVLSQRLVRKLCTACRREASSIPVHAREFFSTIPDGFTFYEGPGCEACGFSGFRGRMLLADLWVPDDEDMILVTTQAPFNEIRRSAERTTFSMARDAHERLTRGLTTVDELLRVMPYSAVVEHRQRFSTPS
jgi:type IV pilus assembly protein PilB